MRGSLGSSVEKSKLKLDQGDFPMIRGVRINHLERISGDSIVVL